jgi:hypothetical protein
LSEKGSLRALLCENSSFQQFRQLRYVGRNEPLGSFAISSCLLDVLVFLSRTGRPCEAQREDANVTVRLALTVRFRSTNRKTPSWGDKAKPPVVDRPTALLFYRNPPCLLPFLTILTLALVATRNEYLHSRLVQYTEADGRIVPCQSAFPNASVGAKPYPH